MGFAARPPSLPSSLVALSLPPRRHPPLVHQGRLKKKRERERSEEKERFVPFHKVLRHRGKAERKRRDWDQGRGQARGRPPRSRPSGRRGSPCPAPRPRAGRVPTSVERAWGSAARVERAPGSLRGPAGPRFVVDSPLRGRRPLALQGGGRGERSTHGDPPALKPTGTRLRRDAGPFCGQDWPTGTSGTSVGRKVRDGGPVPPRVDRWLPAGQPVALTERVDPGTCPNPLANYTSQEKSRHKSKTT